VHRREEKLEDAKRKQQRRMNMKVTIKKLYTVAAIGFLTVCASVIPASAQNAIGGRFTLTHEIRWQNATLPAGDYTFTAAGRHSPMIVSGPNGSVFELAQVVDNKSDGPSVIKLERRGGIFYVRELDLPQVGVQLSYNVPSAPKDEELAQGPATEQILVAMAK
jgi:hypothetical protein